MKTEVSARGNMKRPQEIGLFDFDGTLVNGDSFLRFGVYAVGKAKFVIALFKALPWIAAWKGGLLTSSRAKEKLFGSLFKGMPYAEFKRKGESFASEMEGVLRRDVLQELERVHATGGLVVIASASVEEWIRPWAERYSVDFVIATKAEVDSDGKLTGGFSTPNCRGAEKARRVREYLDGILGDKTRAYATRNYGVHSGEETECVRVCAWGNLPDDREMLDMADEPHPV